MECLVFLYFFCHLMRLRPMPSVMCSSLTQSALDIRARRARSGAIDFVAKPMIAGVQRHSEAGSGDYEKVTMAAHARVIPHAVEFLCQALESA